MLWYTDDWRQREGGITVKKRYEKIELALVTIGEDDVIRTSIGGGTIPPVDDENQGEWAWSKAGAFAKDAPALLFSPKNKIKYK